MRLTAGEVMLFDAQMLAAEHASHAAAVASAMGNGNGGDGDDFDDDDEDEDDLDEDLEPLDEE